MFRIPAKFQNVPLGDTYVLEQLPSRVGSSLRLFPSKLAGETGQNRLHIDMSLPAAQQLVEVLTK
jgi:hypothetical protein